MHKKRFFVLLILLLLSACQNSQKEEAFRAKYQDISMNTDLRFWKPSDKFIIGESIVLELENLSSDKIVFSHENDVKALAFKSGKWIELNNSAIYYLPSGERQISPKGPDIPGVISIPLVPQLHSNGSRAVTIRVVVIGSIYKEDKKTEDKTGAYIDVRLEP
jgi:hypothetical protein